MMMLNQRYRNQILASFNKNYMNGFRGYKVTINQIRIGQVIEFCGSPNLVTKATHSVTGRGSAHVKLELKDIVTGKKMTERFKTSDSVEAVQITSKTLPYLYHDNEFVYVFDFETLEQTSIPIDAMQGGKLFLPLLQESSQLSIQVLDQQPITAKLPIPLIVEILDTPGIIKASVNPTSSKRIGFKTALLAGGLSCEVPEFCLSGEKIEVSIDDSNLSLTYKSRHRP